MKTATKKDIIRKGDVVIIEQPIRFVRVGYDLNGEAAMHKVLEMASTANQSTN